MIIKITLLVLFVACMISVGIYSQSKVKSVNDFVLGGRGVGPWLTAFAYGTSYFFGSSVCRLCRTVLI